MLFFIVGFFLLREPIWMSLIYGLITGGSVYQLIAWWQNDEKPEAIQEPDFIPFSKDINRALIKSKLIKPDNTKANNPTRALSLLEWLIKEDKSPPSQ
ncbi:MAG: hypothetical protein WA933_12025 [Microcoleaceae cyanobacterium]